MFKKILLGVDGSEHALKAARLVGEMARRMESSVLVVASFDPIPAYLGQPNLQEAIAARMQQADQILQPALEAIGDIGTTVETEVLEGTPAESILAAAELHHIDLIVMGTRGLGRLSGLLLGSQSQKVVAHATCPVLLVR
ncbi:MAG: universal stress protein [Anaerolineales bacterium]|nr:universal stress protein [Anaerolineales bacterium]